MRNTWTEYERITRQQLMKRQSLSGGYGWNPYSEKPSNGTGWIRFRLRGLEKVNIESLLIATGQKPEAAAAEMGLGPATRTKRGSAGSHRLSIYSVIRPLRYE